jgi:hypothetical protein
MWTLMELLSPVIGFFICCVIVFAWLSDALRPLIGG